MAKYPRLVALAAGTVSAAGFAPLGLWPVAIVALALLLWLVRRATSGRQAFGLGWLFGLTHFAVGLNWIATAFTYQAEMPSWIGWVAVVGLAAFLAIYLALTALMSWWIDQRHDPERARSPLAFVLAFAGLWIITEWLRSWVFTGFSWNPLSATLLDTPLRGWLPLIGTYAASGLAALLAGALLLASGRYWRAAGGLALALVLPAWLMTPQALDRPDGRSDATAITLVQPNVPQDDITDETKFESQFQTLARLTARLPDQTGKRLVLWPESAVPDYLERGYPPVYYYRTTFKADPDKARMRIAEVIGPDSIVLTGAVDLEMRGRKVVGARNAVTALDDQGRIIGSYDKAHLVPGGEYLPLRWLMEPLGASRLVAGTLDFWPGPGPRTLSLSGSWPRPGVQNCYEIVFSGQVVDRSNRPDFIFNPSNDGWFGAWGPPQHLAQARMRALEEGLPVLRSTTNGISGVIAADGRLLMQIAEDRADRLDFALPPALEPTVFSKLGNWLVLIVSAALLALSVTTSIIAYRRARR